MAKYDAKALSVFDTVCRAIDSEKLKYTEDKEKLIVFLTAKGDDLPINVLFKVDTERQVLTVHSLLDTTVSDDKRVEFAIAINAANYALVNGSFDFSINDGKIIFRMAHPYLDVGISQRVVQYLLYCVFSTVDEYNDRFLMLDKGMISIEKFVELANS